VLFSPQIISRSLRSPAGGSGGGGGGGLPITGLIGYWDTSVTASLTLTGGSPNAITSIADQSGNGLTLTWANTRPQYSPTQFNTSYPGMATDVPSNRALEVSSFPMGTGNTLTVWYVGSPNFAVTPNNGRVLSYAKSGSQDYDNAGSWHLHANGSQTQSCLSRNGTNVAKTGLTANGPYRIIATVDPSGVITVYANNSASSTGTSAGNWVSGGTFAIGRRAATGFDYGANVISEVGVSANYSDATAVAALDTYLKNKWGL
jgi:hypothetical protein